jgi:hypothetical protein
MLCMENLILLVTPFALWLQMYEFISNKCHLENCLAFPKCAQLSTSFKGLEIFNVLLNFQHWLDVYSHFSSIQTWEPGISDASRGMLGGYPEI